MQILREYDFDATSLQKLRPLSRQIGHGHGQNRRKDNESKSLGNFFSSFKIMSASRHLGRVIVTQTLFAFEFHGGDPEAILEYVSREFGGKISDLSFAYELLNGALKFRNEEDKLIAKYAPEWPIEKIAPIDRAILELAVFEMLHSKDVPAVVAIDEAIELAKSFGNEKSPKFINGVLNAVFKSNGPTISRKTN